jgi:ribosomal protein S27E
MAGPAMAEVIALPMQSADVLPFAAANAAVVHGAESVFGGELAMAAGSPFGAESAFGDQLGFGQPPVYVGRPALTLVPPLESPPAIPSPVEVSAAEETPAFAWRDADTITGLRLAREAAKAKAAQILEERTRLLGENPETTEVPNPVDPLSTAARLIAARKKYGKQSPEYREARASLVHDCRRLFAEAYRKNTWEYFPETEQPYDETVGDYTFMGYPLTTMVEQGVTPLAEQEEQTARTSELMEEAGYKAVRTLGSLAVGKVTVLKPARPAFAGAEAQEQPEVRAMTIAECPDWAIDAYKRNSKGGWGGYVPENEKLMLRGVRCVGSGSRFQEQLALPGKEITHKVVVEWLGRKQVIKPEEQPTKEEVRSKQLLSLECQDVFAVGRELDSIASELGGKTIFLGEAVSEDHPRDYEAAREEAARRQAKQERQSNELADFLVALEEAGVDHWPAQGIVEKQVKKMVFAGVKGDREAAAAAFDEKTADRVDTAIKLRAAGNELAAKREEAKAEKEAPDPPFCGSGSCGLKDGKDSKEKSRMSRELDQQDDESLVQDVERACKNCGKKTLWYVFSDKVVKTGCSSCGAVVVEQTSGPGRAGKESKQKQVLDKRKSN